MSVHQILLALSGNPALPPAQVDELLATEDPAVSRELATRQCLTPAQIEHLAALGDRDVLLALIESGQLAIERISHDDPWMMLAAIGRADASEDWLRVLASWPDLAVRQALAVHAAERRDIAEVLAGDEVCSVAACAAQLWELPEELALRLADRTEACVRVALASSRPSIVPARRPAHHRDAPAGSSGGRHGCRLERGVAARCAGGMSARSQECRVRGGQPGGAT